MGLFSKKYTPPRMDHFDAETLYCRGLSAQDPRDAHAFLTRAAELAPDDLRIRKALLLHGRLHERDPHNPSFHVIKCYLLHVFEHPEDHDEIEAKRMAREIFDHDQLACCLALATDPEAFLREYLFDLSLEYVRLFIAGDATHTRTVLGVTLTSKLPAFLAAPAYDVITNTFASAHLNADEQLLLAGAFYRAYRTHMEGRTEPLDEKLGNLLGRLMK